MTADDEDFAVRLLECSKTRRGAPMWITYSTVGHPIGTPGCIERSIVIQHQREQSGLAVRRFTVAAENNLSGLRYRDYAGLFRGAGDLRRINNPLMAKSLVN